jgi:Zn-finger nucleic acid-binding protein
MRRPCPEDLTPLEVRRIRDLDLDVCPQCAGIYFDEGEVAALQSKGAAALHEVEAAVEPGSFAIVESPVPKRCPGCQSAMTGYRYRYSSDIRVDGCEKCGGIWIQDGELEKIAVHMKTARSTFGGTPAAREAAAVANARERAAHRHEQLMRRVAYLFG